MYRANATDQTCPEWATLVECYYAFGSLNMGTGTMHISERDFFNLMLAIYFDVDGRNPADLILVSAGYDTPFYDLSRTGFADTGKPLPGSACIAGYGCYTRTEINYVAQGIVAAAAMQSREAGLARVYAWKWATAFHGPSQGTIDMFNVGYDFYHTQDGSTPPVFNPPFLEPVSTSPFLVPNR